jgi:hypothetical protein
VTISLDTLKPHRVTLRALAPILVGDAEEGVFARNTGFSRRRVQTVFHDVVTRPTDAPNPAVASALGHLLYLAHSARSCGGCSTAARVSAPRRRCSR